MALISAETATMVVVLALLVIVKAEPPAVPEVPGTTFINFDDKNSATCLQDAKVSILKDFLPVHAELNTVHHEYRCQLPHGEKPDDVTDEQWGKTQYVTLYNAEERIPIFSAYKAEPYITPITTKKTTKDTGDRAKMAWEEAAGSNSPKSSDYTLLKEYDRGHLFPVRLASDPIQAQATMKLTNAVPQNSFFNQNQWNWAGENILMKTAVLECQKKGWTPVVLTGAIPDYDPMKGGFDGFDRRAYKIRVPTHMWSACFCVAAGGAVEDFSGFIGINLRVGFLKWYSSFETFDATLKKMYRISTDGTFFPIFPTPSQSDELKNAIAQVWADSGSSAIKERMELPIHNDRLNYWDDRDRSWENLFVRTIQQEMNVLFEQFEQFQQLRSNEGYEDISLTIGDKTDMLDDVDPDISEERRTNYQKTSEEKRKKRSVITTQVHSKYALIKVVDASLTSDLSLTTCTFKESYDGGEETHELNLEEGAFIKDPKPAGEATLSAVVNKTPVPERPSTNQHISIVLTGRN